MMDRLGHNSIAKAKEAGLVPSVLKGEWWAISKLATNQLLKIVSTPNAANAMFV